MTVKQKKKKENKQPKKIIFVCKFLLNFVPCPIKHIKFNLTFIPPSTCFCKPVNQNKDKDFFFKGKKNPNPKKFDMGIIQNCLELQHTNFVEVPNQSRAVLERKAPVWRSALCSSSKMYETFPTPHLVSLLLSLGRGESS